MGGLGLNRSREFGDDGVVGSHFVAIGGVKDWGELLEASGERCCEGDGGVGGTDWHGGEVAPSTRSVAVVAGIATPVRARKAMSEPGTFAPGGRAAVMGWLASTASGAQ